MKTLKKTILIGMVFLLCMPCVARSQAFLEVFTSKSFTWYGLDFSNAKMIGPHGFNQPDRVVNQYFSAWNDLFIIEEKKYDLKKTFNKDFVYTDLKTVTERNSLVDHNELVISANENYKLDNEQVKMIIKEYGTDNGQRGVGLVFVVESFNKHNETGTMWVTFFDMESKGVLLTKKMEGKAGGFGFRNHWARSIHNVLNDMQKEFRKWERAYLK